MLEQPMWTWLVAGIVVYLFCAALTHGFLKWVVRDWNYYDKEPVVGFGTLFWPVAMLIWLLAEVSRRTSRFAYRLATGKKIPKATIIKEDK